MTSGQIAKMRKGTEVDGVHVTPVLVETVTGDGGPKNRVAVEVEDGRNREVRRIAESAGGCEEFEADENRWLKNAFRTSSWDVLSFETTSSFVCFREIASSKSEKIFKVMYVCTTMVPIGIYLRVTNSLQIAIYAL